MEIKTFAFTELKADDDARTVEGWASTFGNTDSYDDVVAPGAFADSIKTRKPRMLWQHKSDQVIGVWDELQETPQGLYVKGRVLDTALGQDAYKLAKAGAVDSMSIGYQAKKYTIDDKTGTRTLHSVDLWEVSLVTFPANEQAKITRVKSKPASERELEEFLREAGYSRGEAKALIAKGFKAMSQRDADEPTQRDADAPPALDLDALTSLFNQFKA